jgi:predicted metalloendopeptidase
MSGEDADAARSSDLREIARAGGQDRVRLARDHRKVAAERDRQRGSARQIADPYASLMDQAHADELGLRPVAALLQRIDAMETPHDLASAAGHLGEE